MVLFSCPSLHEYPLGHPARPLPVVRSETPKRLRLKTTHNHFSRRELIECSLGTFSYSTSDTDVFGIPTQVTHRDSEDEVIRDQST